MSGRIAPKNENSHATPNNESAGANPRSLIYKLSVVAASTLSRLLGTLLLFALVARAVGPADFGVFAYWYAIGILAAAVSDYGFGQQVLRDLAGAGLPTARARAIGLLVAKGWVSCMVSSVAFIFALVSTSGPQESATALLLISAAMIGSVFDYLSMVLRSRAELRTESLLAGGMSIGASLAAGWAAYTYGDVLAASVLLLCVRVLFVVVQARILFGSVLYVSNASRAKSSPPRTTLKRSAAFAIDNLALQLFANLDALLIKYLVDPHSAGLYLAGARLTQASLAGLPVIASIFLPMMSMVGNHAGTSKSIHKKAYLISLCAGLSMLAGCVILRSIAPTVLFGPTFGPVGELMPLFGIYLAIRYLAAAPGMALTSAGKQKSRAAITVLSVAFSIAYIGGIYAGGYVLELRNLCYMMIVGAAIQFAGYLVAGRGLAAQTRPIQKE